MMFTFSLCHRNRKIDWFCCRYENWDFIWIIKKKGGDLLEGEGGGERDISSRLKN